MRQSKRGIRARIWPVLGAVVFGVACGGDEVPPASELVRPVRAIQVPDPTEAALRSFTGRARASKRTLLSFEVEGRILERRVDVGTHVEQGQLLASLDPRDFENARSAAQAKTKEARAYRDRVAEAHEVRAVSDQELTDAESGLRSAAATLRIREKALEDSRLIAPHAGEIAAVYVENFQVVRAKEPIFRLLDASRIEMVIDLPENLIGLVDYVTDVVVRFDAFPDREIHAEIAEVGREASATTRTYPVTLGMDQPPGMRIHAGMTGRASGRAVLPEGRAGPPIFVPASAVFSFDGRSYVWALDPQTKQAARRKVEVADETARGVPIVDGLRPHEWVAISGTHTLTQGQEVEILDVSLNEWRLPMPEARGVAAGDVTLNSLEH